MIAYPYAYTVTLVSPKMRNILMTVVMLPFWTSVIARNFAWVLLLQQGGPVDSFFSFIGIDGVVLLRTLIGVTIAMAHRTLQPHSSALWADCDAIACRAMGEWLGQYTFETIEEAQDQAMEWL